MAYISKFKGSEIDQILTDVRNSIKPDLSKSIIDINKIGKELSELSAEVEEINEKINNLPQDASMTAITYVDLVNLRDNGELVVGSYYRITDYDTTTTQPNTRSAAHPFDVIVLALSENTLAEEAYAIKSERDTDGYFANSNLAAWELWYCLDNDTTRFAWADTENGKGVIYRMIDEWNNDIPYDFKNIMYIDMTKSKISAEANYYGNWWAGELIRKPSGDTLGRYAWELTKVSGPSSSYTWYTDDKAITSVDTTFYEYDGNEFNISETLRITNLSIGQMQYTFGNPLSPDSAISEFVDYTVTQVKCLYNTIRVYNLDGQKLNNIIFGSNCYSNNFGTNCYNISFGDNCHDNSFGDNCYDNTFYYSCFSNNFGNSCYDNTFGNSCFSNTFGDNCFSNTFGNNYHDNTFGNNCSYNTFGDYCNQNTFGNNCIDNTFGNNCSYKTFGDSCTSLSFSEGTGTSHIIRGSLYTVDAVSRNILPALHPDLSTQPSILPYRFMGNLVYEELIPCRDLFLEWYPCYEKPLILSCDLIGECYRMSCNATYDPLINELLLSPIQAEDIYRQINFEDMLFVRITYTKLEELSDGY